MAVVLSSEDDGYFAPMSLRRSHSQSHIVGTPYHPTSADLKRSYEATSSTYSDDSITSSPPSSPRTAHSDSTDLSCVSTPATNFLIASEFEDSLAIDDSPDDRFDYRPFDQQKLFINPQIRPDVNLEPPPSPRTGDSYTVSPAEQESAESTSRPGTPEYGEHAEDDTAVTTRPSRQVDYLSHEWREEEIWSSWRYIIARRGKFPNSARLENASWRTWMKAKNNLKTISPETLNWLKDCDVTWLYGPLQPSKKSLHSTQTEPSSTSLSKSDSLVNMNKKPILKKRSMSEVMLRRSLSTASLLKQATAAVQAQETRGILRPSLARSNTDYITFPFSTRRQSSDVHNSLSQSTESSGIASPCTERKHIHFNEQVEQCIAVDVKGDDEDDLDADIFGGDSDSDDGVMMKRTRSKKRLPPSKRRSKKTLPSDGKIIAMLPSTTLKYREDTPEPQETAMKHSTGVSHSPILSPSSSQETLRPAKTSTRFFIFEDDDEDVDESIPSSISGWASSSSDSTSPAGLSRSTSTNSLSEEPSGMRRTASGMLMPYEEGDSSTGDGIFGRVIDTVNTARDIAHVIWNVGWRA
jgi:hypothetical protein